MISLLNGLGFWVHLTPIKCLYLGMFTFLCYKQPSIVQQNDPERFLK